MKITIGSWLHPHAHARLDGIHLLREEPRQFSVLRGTHLVGTPAGTRINATANGRRPQAAGLRARPEPSEGNVRQLSPALKSSADTNTEPRATPSLRAGSRSSNHHAAACFLVELPRTGRERDQAVGRGRQGSTTTDMPVRSQFSVLRSSSLRQLSAPAVRDTVFAELITPELP